MGRPCFFNNLFRSFLIYVYYIDFFQFSQRIIKNKWKKLLKKHGQPTLALRSTIAHCCTDRPPRKKYAHTHTGPVIIECVSTTEQIRLIHLFFYFSNGPIRIGELVSPKFWTFFYNYGVMFIGRKWILYLRGNRPTTGKLNRARNFSDVD